MFVLARQACSTCGGQKLAAEPQELGVQVVVHSQPPMVPGTKPGFPCKSSKCRNCRAISQALLFNL